LEAPGGKSEVVGGLVAEQCVEVGSNVDVV
jgi:hypothetical protein